MKLILILILSLFAFIKVDATHIARQQLGFQIIKKNNEISISGPPPEFIINIDPSSDEESNILINDSNTYSVTTSTQGTKITGVIDRPMPKNTALSLYLAPPSGALTTGPVDLNTIEQDLVINLPRTTETGIEMIFQFSATKDAEEAPFQMRILTLTLIDINP